MKTTQSNEKGKTNETIDLIAFTEKLTNEIITAQIDIYGKRASDPTEEQK
jgi:hypothetical protein